MAERRYTKNGEWIWFDGSHWRVGWAASVIEDLGDINFVEAPAIGRVVAAGEAVCTIEAVKAAADYYSPVSGRIAAVNPRLTAEPELMNASPEDEAWLFSLDQVGDDELEGLFDAEGWKAWESGR